jgi:hypothetical protein
MLAEKIRTQLINNFKAGRELDRLQDSFVEYTKTMRELVKQAYIEGVEDSKYFPDFEQSFSKQRLDVLTKGL